MSMELADTVAAQLAELGHEPDRFVAGARETILPGPRTDVYLLGAVLYELLVGRPPHLADTLVGMLAEVSRSDRTIRRRVSVSSGRSRTPRSAGAASARSSSASSRSSTPRPVRDRACCSC